MGSRTAAEREHILAALEGRTAARDLYDVAYLAEKYPESFSRESRERAKRFVLDLDSVESRFRPAFEADDLFAERANVDETILRLQATLDKPIPARQSKIDDLGKTS